MKRGIRIVLAAILFATVIAITASAINQRRTTARDEATADETPSGERWEYLVVSGANNNLTASGNPNLRKDTSGFSRESFVLEQALDKLGAKGWELVSVSSSPSDAIYYLKRKK